MQAPVSSKPFAAQPAAATEGKRPRQMVPTIEEQEENQPANQQRNQLTAPSLALSSAAAPTEPAPLGPSASLASPSSSSDQQQQHQNQNPPATPTKYLSSLISRSSTLINSLKQQYYSGGGGGGTRSPIRSASMIGRNSATNARSETMHTSSIDSGSSSLSAAEPSSPSAGQTTTSTGAGRPPAVASSSSSPEVAAAAAAACPAKRPAIPPRPPAGAVAANSSAAPPQTESDGHHHQQLVSSSKQRSLDVTNLQAAGTRRHALQEQSLERDAALSLKVHKLHKHKRTSSIKSALKHAHLGPLRVSSSGQTNSSGSSSSGSSFSHHKEQTGAGCGDSGPASSMPYELFEPPVTQRTVQRSRRRGAMSQDSKRQMSADTIGLRQLTDEYLQNAGLKPISSSGQCSLVALTASATTTAAPGHGSSGAPASASSMPGSGLVTLRHQDSGGGGGGGGLASASHQLNQLSQQQQQQQQQNLIEAQLYQASKHLSARGDSQDSFSSVTILPGNLPWQSDVSIQCELLRPAPAELDEPYESTGDILQTIAGPFRPSRPHSSYLQQRQQQQAQSFDSLGGAATLKRKLTAISHHHLSPIAVAQNVVVGASAGAGSSGAAALNVVVGSLKKSLSNTLDVGLLQATPYLHSQDSLPAYASLKNEPDSPTEPSGSSSSARQRCSTDSQEQPAAAGESIDSSNSNSGSNNNNSLIGQITSKITRQSSKKFSASKKGLQRALSFDYRGYKKLEPGAGASAAAGRQQSANGDANCPSSSSAKGSSHLLSAATKLASHNRSSLGLNHHHHNQPQQESTNLSASGPRPYLPQSASQVDFQVPLLPYHKMQEAIVAQRLLDPSGGGRSASQSQLCLHHGADMTPPAMLEAEQQQQQQPDADELLCAPIAAGQADFVAEPQQVQTKQQQQGKTSPPRLVLDIPTIATHQAADQQQQQRGDKRAGPRTRPNKHNSDGSTTSAAGQYQPQQRRRPEQEPARAEGRQGDGEEEEEPESDESGGEDAYANEQDESSRSTVIVCLPSPNIAIEPRFSSISNPSSYELLQMQQQQQRHGPTAALAPGNMQPASFLSANDIFCQSNSLIKRPSTMMTATSADEAISQVAQAFNRNRSQQQQPEAANVALRNRRRAIVPPKLATDASGSDAEGAREGQLVDIGGETDESELDGRRRQEQEDEELQRAERDEEATMRALRRKRSGGGAHSTAGGSAAKEERKALSGSQTSIPTFRIEQEQQPTSDSSGQPETTSRASAAPRPDSQMTNVDSLVSSASSLSISGRRSGEFTITSPGGLTVPFGSLKNRRRSSIAIIPQMQICPGDLLVYSKQMIDRMNQNDHQDSADPAHFLIDDKKGKNIWSSLKLCAQFDNRTQKARNELLCSLEDVLASLQPSTFADEQLSRYKGMNWNDFLIETGSRRSASSEALDNLDDNYDGGDCNEQMAAGPASQRSISHLCELQSLSNVNTINNNNSDSNPQLDQTVASTQPDRKEPIKVTLSSGPAGPLIAGSASGGSHRSRDPTVKPTGLASRFKEKPKLKRGQTVDSVFRIPLIPISPLKHAQQHQQTPTAHLEQDNDDLLIAEDDERSSPGAGSGSRESSLNRTGHHHTRSSSIRSRRDSGRQTSRAKCQQNGTESGEEFEMTPIGAKPAATVAVATSGSGSGSRSMMRQSSLSTLSSTITRTEQKRQRALWDLFQSECAFFFDHLMTLKNVYMEPLKKIQVEGFAMFADPDVLFGNLDELCCGVYDFTKEFLCIIRRTLKTRPEELNATDVLIKLYKKNPKIDHLRGVYHRYTLNYINAITYLDSLRNQVEFTEFETWSSRDARCKKLQLTDLLVAPVQHIMRVPIILKDIESHTENPKDRDEIRAILAVEEASLRELDDKMRWLKNFERLLEIQKNIVWPTVYDMAESKLIPECLREVLTKQPIERLIVSPWRQIVHEGTLTSLDTGKPADMHVILFDDMLLLTRRKKALTKKASTICKTNSGSSSMRDDGSFKYNVYKQPISLDRFTVHDIDPMDAQALNVKHMFVLVVMNRFQQFTNVHSFAASNDDVKQTWMFKMRKTQERWQRNQLNNTPNDQQQQHKQPDPQQSANYQANNPTNKQQPRSKVKTNKPAELSGQHSS